MNNTEPANSNDSIAASDESSVSPTSDDNSSLDEGQADSTALASAVVKSSLPKKRKKRKSKKKSVQLAKLEGDSQVEYEAYQVAPKKENSEVVSDFVSGKIKMKAIAWSEECVVARESPPADINPPVSNQLSQMWKDLL